MATKRKLNKSRLLILAALVVLLMAGGGGFYAWRKARIRLEYARYRTDGLAAARDGDKARAVDLLGRYLQRYPDEVDALAAYAQVRPEVPLPKGEHIRQTIAALRQLLKLDPGRRPEQLRLLDLYVQTHYWAEAINLSNQLLPSGHQAGKDDLAVVIARTKALIGTRSYDQARQMALEWNFLRRDDLDGQLMLLDLAHQTHNLQLLDRAHKTQIYADEIQLADAMLHAAAVEAGAKPSPAAATQPDTAVVDLPAVIVRAHAQALAGHPDKAVELLASADKWRPADAHVARILMAELDRLGRTDQSLAILRQLEAETHDPVLRDALARRLWEAGQSAPVADLLAKLDPADPLVSADLIALRIMSLTASQRQADADAVRRTLAARASDPLAAAWAAVLQPADPAHPADPRHVVQLCRDALQQQGSAYLGFFLGQMYERLGESDLALAAWRNATGVNATWSLPPLRIAQTLLETGRYDQAADAAREAIRRGHSIAAGLCLARALDLTLTGAASPQADQVLTLIGALEDAKAKAKAKDQGETLCIKADALARIGRGPEAAAAIRAALDKPAADAPLSEASLLQLAAVSRKYRLQLEDRCFARSELEHGVTASLAQAEATDRIVAGRADDGLKLFDDLRNRSKSPNDLAWQWARFQCLDIGKDARAYDEIARLASQNPGNLQIQLKAANYPATAAAPASRETFLEQAIARLQAITGGQGAAYRLARARWLLEFRKDAQSTDEASKLLTEVVQLSPQSLEAHLLLSVIAQRAGRLPESIDQMKVVVGLSPDSVSMGVRLASLLDQSGDFDGAHQELARVQALPAASPQERRNAAELAAQVGDPRLALNLAQEIAATDGSEDHAGTLLLAQLNWRGGRTAEAERLLNKLLANPDLSTIRFASQLYLSEGRVEDATRVMGRLDSLKLAPGVKELALANFAQMSGSDDPVKHLVKATEAPGQTDSTAWRALMAYQIAANKTDEALATFTTALRTLPADHALQSLDHQRLIWASPDAMSAELRPFTIGLIRNPMDAAPADALRAFVPLAAAHAGTAQWVAAAKEAADRHPQFAPLQLFLVQRELRAGRPDDAANAAALAARRCPASAEPQALYVSILRDQNRWQEVLAEAQKWRDRFFSDRVSADLQIAEAYVKLNRPGDAVKQLEPYIQNAAGSPRNYQLALPAYAAACKASGQGGTAELMEPLLDKGPRGRQAWMAFALQNLKPDEAQAWLDRVEQKIPSGADSERIALAESYGFLADRTSDPAQTAKKARALLEPIASKPDASESAILALAVRNEHDGRIPDAIDCYRRVLKLNPANIVAQNNLAMVLAGDGASAGSLDEAAKLAQSAIKERQDVPALYDTLAFVQGKQRKFADAIANEQTAVQKMPQNPSYRITLAQFQFDAGHPIEAADVLRQLDAARLNVSALPAKVQDQLAHLRAMVNTSRSQASAK